MARDGFSTTVLGATKNVQTRSATATEYEGIRFVIDVAREKSGDNDFLVAWGKGDNSVYGPSGTQFRVKSSSQDELAHWVYDAANDVQTLDITLRITYDPNQSEPDIYYVVTPGSDPEP